MATKSPMENLYKICLDRAVDAIGGQKAFMVIGSTLRTALVASEILILADSQDDSVAGDTVRKLISELRDIMTSDESLAV